MARVNERDSPEAWRGAGRPTAAYLAMAAVLFGKVLLARWLILGPAWLSFAIISEAVLVLAVLGLVDLLFRRRRFAAYVAFDVVLSLFLAALTAYATFYERMMAPGALKLAGQIGSIVPSILALLGPAYLLYVIDVPLIVIFRRTLRVFAGSHRRLRPATYVLIAAMLVVAPALTLWAGLGSADAAGGDVATAGSHGILAYECAAVAKAVLGPGMLGAVGIGEAAVAADFVARDLDYSDPQSVQEAIEVASRRGSGDRIAMFKPGQYAGANVIVIQVESLQRFAVGSWVTPNLYALAEASWYFPNGFSQSGLGTTSDAEFAMNASLYPPTDGPASVEYEDRVIPALPRLLGGIGYYSFTMHANTVRYWNRKELYPALGFADYYDRAFFGRNNTIGMGASDRMLFMKALPVIVEEASRGPIYCQLVTLTPHHPFRMPPSTIKLNLPAWLEDSTVGNYLEAMNYEDRQIGWFVDKLKENGLWDRSIVVIYGDHAGLRASDLDKDENRSRLEAVLEHSYTSMDRANVPIIIHVPGQESGVFCTTAVGQVDIMPTIADALGLDLTGVPHMGRSVFEATRPLLVGRSGLPSGSFINDRIVCIAGEDFASSEALSLKTREPTDLFPEDERDWKAARALQAISDTYARSLPERLESQGTSGAVIPRKLKSK